MLYTDDKRRLLAQTKKQSTTEDWLSELNAAIDKIQDINNLIVSLTHQAKYSTSDTEVAACIHEITHLINLLSELDTKISSMRAALGVTEHSLPFPENTYA